MFKTSLALSAFLFCLNAQAGVFSCYQGRHNTGATMNVTVRTGNGVVSVGINTLTPGSMYSAQLHILGELKAGTLTAQADDVQVLYSEGKSITFKGFVDKLKGKYGLTMNFIQKRDKKGNTNVILTSLSVKQAIDQGEGNVWENDWQISCRAYLGNNR